MVQYVNDVNLSNVHPSPCPFLRFFTYLFLHWPHPRVERINHAPALSKNVIHSVSTYSVRWLLEHRVMQSKQDYMPWPLVKQRSRNHQTKSTATLALILFTHKPSNIHAIEYPLTKLFTCGIQRDDSPTL